MRTYRALNHRFSLQVPEGELAQRLHAVFEPLGEEASGLPGVAYRVEACDGASTEAWRLRSGEAVLIDRGDREFLTEQLAWQVNRSAIESVVGSRVVLHAGVVHRVGVTVLLAGASGSGKSTLTAGLTAMGWDYVTDEAASIDPVALMIDPYPKAVSLTYPSLLQLDELRSRPPRPSLGSSHAHKVQVSPVDFGAVAEALVPPPTIVLFPVWSERAAVSHETLSSAEAVVRLCQHAFFPTIARQRDLDALARTVAGAACTREMRFGSLPEAIALVEDLACSIGS